MTETRLGPTIKMANLESTLHLAQGDKSSKDFFLLRLIESSGRPPIMSADQLDSPLIFV
jgi:hypothetical protein